MFDDVGALSIGARKAALAIETALDEGATGAIDAGIRHGAGSLSCRGALAGETALIEAVTRDLDAGIGFGAGSPPGIRALGRCAAFGKGESSVFFLGNSDSSSLSLFFPCFTRSESSMGWFCFFCGSAGDVEGGLAIAASSPARFPSSPCCNPVDPPVVCFCLFSGSRGRGEGGLHAADSSSSLFFFFPSFNSGDSSLFCFCNFFGGAGFGEGGINDACGGVRGEVEDIGVKIGSSGEAAGGEEDGGVDITYRDEDGDMTVGSWGEMLCPAL